MWRVALEPADTLKTRERCPGAALTWKDGLMADRNRTAKKAAATPPGEEPAVSPSSTTTGADPAPEPTASSTDAGGHTYVLEFTGVDDGPVTFTRGDESETFEVKGERITTNKERADWLVNNTAARPVAEKE